MTATSTYRQTWGLSVLWLLVSQTGTLYSCHCLLKAGYFDFEPMISSIISILLGYEAVFCSRKSGLRTCTQNFWHSNKAIFLPTQRLLPYPKENKYLIILFSFATSSSQRLRSKRIGIESEHTSIAVCYVWICSQLRLTGKPDTINFNAFLGCKAW